MAELYARAIPKTRRVRCAGVFDPSAEKARALADRLGGRAYDSFDALLGDEAASAALVLTPTPSHVEVARRCLVVGKHVLVEKPVAATVTDIDLLDAAARAAGRACMPAHNYIYTPSMRRARQLVEDNAFAPVTSFWGVYNIFHDDALAARYGGVLRAVSIHHAYSLLYLLGRPRHVTAVASRTRPDLGDEDQVMVICGMENGAMANLWASFAADDPTNWDHLRTSNPIESVFATVRHRTVRTKGALSPTTARLMVFKLAMVASKTWRRLKGENQLPKVVAGVAFQDGTEVIDRTSDRAA